MSIAKISSVGHVARREPDLTAKINEIIVAITSLDNRLAYIEQKLRIGDDVTASAERRWAKRRKDAA
jgi:hypothetical protein